MIDKNAQDLLEKRYFKPNEKTWEDLSKRVAVSIANGEETNTLKKKYTDIF